MATVTVSTTAGLLSALKSAHSGDTIMLAAGTYSNVNIFNYHPNGTINITSASGAHPAVLTDLDINQSSGLKFSNLTFATTLYNAPTSTSAPTPFGVYNSSNISFNEVSVHGTMDNNPQDDVNGLRIESSSNVSITNSTFQQLYNAIGDLNNNNIVISNNSIHDIRNDGIDNGGSSNVVISGNSFTNFYPVGAVGTTGDHADAIQFWTTGTTTDANNIVVENNTFVRGTGSYIQGIFMTDQVGLGYNNVTVTGNTMIGAEYNAIDVESATNVNVSNNVVEAYSGIVNYIRLNADTGVTMNNNVTPGFELVNVGFVSQLANQTTGIVAPLASLAALNILTPVTAVAQTANVNEYRTVTGNLLTGDHGTGLYLADVGVSAANQSVVAATGSTVFKGSYGTLTVQANGTYSYAETKTPLTVGQTYDDHFTLTIASPTGGVQSTTLDFTVTGSGVGNGVIDTIDAGSGAETISGFGGHSLLVSGTGPDTFVFSGVASSTPAAQTMIQGFKPGDIIDLSGVDPNFHIVTKFDGHPNELIVGSNGAGSWEIYGDTTGSGVANFQLHLTSATITSLTAANFHL